MIAETEGSNAAPRRCQQWWRRLGWLVTLAAVAWALAALWFMHPAYAWGLALVVAGFAWRFRREAWLPMALPVVPTLALGGWFSVPARNDRPWIPEVSRTASGDIAGDVITLHNVRNFQWRSAMDFTPQWETRTFRLSQLRHLDLLMTYWGSPHVCHTMVTFDFGPGGRLCVSIEARREHGEEYSAVAGVFRRFELVYVFGDERDLVRLRTRIRPDNDVYLFRLNATPAVAQAMFLDYVATANGLRDQPEWYHSLTTNCSTTIRRHVRRAEVPDPWDWRVVANGYIDGLLYDRGYVARDLPLPELKRRSLITPAARAADTASDFSDQIRAGRPGF